MKKNITLQLVSLILVIASTGYVLFTNLISYYLILFGHEQISNLYIMCFFFTIAYLQISEDMILRHIKLYASD